MSQVNHQEFLPELATSLSNLGVCLSLLGRNEDALKTTQQSVNIRRHLAQIDSQAFLPDLAYGLCNLGNRLSNSGRFEESLKPMQESVDILRQLAQIHSRAFLHDLARGLGAYGIVLNNTERYDEAVQAFGEGLQHIITPYKETPEAFADLAKRLQRDYLRACQNAGKEPDKRFLLFDKP
jgi:tetratricopeptide (TPR) repeat protein